MAQSPKLVVFKLCLHCFPPINLGEFGEESMLFLHLYLVCLPFPLPHAEQSSSAQDFRTWEKRVEDLLLHVSEGRRKLSLRISKYRIFPFNLSLFFQQLYVVTCILCYVSKSETQQMALQRESVESGFISYLNPRNVQVNLL